jgi:hypothetical protein
MCFPNAYIRRNLHKYEREKVCNFAEKQDLSKCVLLLPIPIQIQGMHLREASLSQTLSIPEVVLPYVIGSVPLLRVCREGQHLPNHSYTRDVIAVCISTKVQRYRALMCGISTLSNASTD